MNQTKSKSNRTLTIVLAVMVIFFLVSTGGALLITLEDGGMMGRGWGSGISWMWIPALLFLTLSIMIVGSMSSKRGIKNDQFIRSKDK